MHPYLVIYSYISTGRIFVNEFDTKKAALEFYKVFAKEKSVAVYVGEWKVLNKRVP